LRFFQAVRVPRKAGSDNRLNFNGRSLEADFVGVTSRGRLSQPDWKHACKLCRGCALRFGKSKTQAVLPSLGFEVELELA